MEWLTSPQGVALLTLLVAVISLVTSNWKRIVPILSKSWRILCSVAERVWNLLCSMFWATYSFLGTPVISRAIEEYKRELSDYCRKRSESAKQRSRRVVLAPRDIWDSVGIVMLVEMKYGMAGQSDAYCDMACYLQEPEKASPPVEHSSYKVVTDDSGYKELVPVIDAESCLDEEPPVLSEEERLKRIKDICWRMQKLVWPPWR